MWWDHAVRFDENAQLDTSNINDLRGGGGALGGRVAVGGGGQGIVQTGGTGPTSGSVRLEPRDTGAATPHSGHVRPRCELG